MAKIILIFAAFVTLISVGYAVNLPSQLDIVTQFSKSLLRTTEASPEASIQTSAIETTPSNKVGVINQPLPTPDWSIRKVDEHMTEFSVPVNDTMASKQELFDAVNSYRRSHNLNTLTSNSTICDIAQKRAQEQLDNGALDNHAGFGKYGESQNEFSHLGEVLYGGQPLSGVHIVEFGWDRSLTGHREALQNPSWQIGCGGIAGVFAAFVFANN